jgi:DNA-binding transcriptional LysR family regulator
MKDLLKGPVAKAVTLKQLRVIAALAKNGRITAAAKELGVTPPAIALQLKLLEDNVGLPLFDRSPVGLRPTDAGTLIVEVESRIAAMLGECDEGLRQLKGLGRGRVSIALVSTSKYFAPRALAAFSRVNPSVEFELLIGNRDETISALTDFRADIAIMGRPPTAIKLEQQVIGDHPHVIIARPDHPLAHRRSLTLRQLMDEVFLLRESGSGTRILADKLFAKSDVEPRVGMECGSNETIKQAVMAGLGVALISAHTIAAEIAERRLAVLNVRGLPIIRKWYMLHMKAKRLLPAGQALWAFLANDGARFLPDARMASDDTSPSCA